MMSDGDAVETVAKLLGEWWPGWDDEAGDEEAGLEERRSAAGQLLQVLVDGGHYVPARREQLTGMDPSCPDQHWDDPIESAIRRHARFEDRVRLRDLRAERDAAITRAETAEALHRYLEDRANDARRAFAEAVELLRHIYTALERSSPAEPGMGEIEHRRHVMEETRAFLARQAVTREEPEPATEKPHKVVDLMAALEASLEAARAEAARAVTEKPE